MRLPLGLMMFLLGAYSASARQITSDEAISAASDFMNSPELRIAKSANFSLLPMKAPGVDANTASNPYYVFNRGESDGFVIISGDDRAPKILGYSDKGCFDAENLPPQLKAMMETWAKQMSELPEVGQHSSWNQSSSTRAEEGVLLETAEWGQYAPFNDLCPTIDGNKAPAGCVATALAIAMKYHNWPDSTRGGVETDYYFPEEAFDFDNYSIDWDALSDKNNPNFAAQAAQLTYSAGVAAHMIYRADESSAEIFAIDHVLNYFYAYDKECQYIPKEKFDEEQWTSMLHDQLNEVGPVVYNGFGTGGHCFVIDGYNSEGMYHVNWGWNGDFNGYYTLGFTLENGMCFDDAQGMVINLRPDKLKKEYSKVWIPDADAYLDSLNGSDGWNFMSPDIEDGVPVTFKGPSMCIGDFRGYVRVAIADEEDNIIRLTDCVSQLDGYRYFCPHPGTSVVGNNVLFPPLQEGQRYRLYSQEVPNALDGPESLDKGYQPASDPSDNPEDWVLVRGGIINPSYFYDKGNPSHITEVRFHIADNLPAYCGTNNSFDKEFTLYKLRGGDCPVTFHVPEKGVKYEVTSTDKEGNPLEALYVTWGDEFDASFLGFNISMYADYFDATLSFEDDGNTRHDTGISSDKLVENDGLIYRQMEDHLELIGYDKVGEIVTIPQSLKVGNQDWPISSISSMALAFAPIKHLKIDAECLEMGRHSFAGMSQLESLSISDLSLLSDHYKRFGFVGSGLKTVCFDKIPEDPYMILYTTGYAYEYIYTEDVFRGVSGVKDIDFIVASAPTKGYDMDYFMSLQILKYMIPVDDMSSTFNSYQIPGLGKVELLQTMENYPFNICQMWDYTIDNENSIVRLDNALENVKIESVFINGEKVEADSEGAYIAGQDAEAKDGMDVLVSFEVNGLHKTTHYTPEYNETVESTDLSGIEFNFDESAMIDIIDINGRMIVKNADRECLKQLEPGVYLTRQGRGVKKIIVR